MKVLWLMRQLFFSVWLRQKLIISSLFVNIMAPYCQYCKKTVGRVERFVFGAWRAWFFYIAVWGGWGMGIAIGELGGGRYPVLVFDRGKVSGKDADGFYKRFGDWMGLRYRDYFEGLVV